MVEAKIESLLERLAIAVAKQEALAGGASAGQAATSAPASTGAKPAGASSALAGELMAATKPHLDALKAAAAVIANATVTQATDFYCEAMEL